jgi:hypothetical protein
VTRPLEGFEEILTQQFWNHIIDARWRRIWKRKNPWFEAWRELTFTYELDAERSPRIAFAALPSGLISTNDDSILSLQLERKNQPTMKSYLLSFAVIVFNHLLTPLWPLPVWLGGRYMNIVKPGYAACIPTKAKYWTFSHLHLAVCTSRYFFVPYVSHNKSSISCRLPNRQFSSFLNVHFFEQTSFEKFEELEPEFFCNRPLVTYTRIQDDEEVSEVLEILEESEESSELYLTDTEDEDLDTNDNSTGLALMIIPFTPVQLDDTNNLPFIQTFIANIFIY